MKAIVASLALLLTVAASAQVAINATRSAPHTSAMLDVSATNKGLLIPRMSPAQRRAIAVPANGLLVYQPTDTVGFWYYNGSKWSLLGGESSAFDHALTKNLTTGNYFLSAAGNNNGLRLSDSGRLQVMSIRSCCNPGSPAVLNMKLDNDGGFLLTGELGIGYSPKEGRGYRTSWYPYKAAFRSGYADNEWDDSATGFFSWSGGSNSTAKGLFSFAFGDANYAASTSSIVFGSGNKVYGAAGFSAGSANRVQDSYGVAMGNKAYSQGEASVALGSNVVAKGFASTVVGLFNDSVLTLDQESISKLTNETPLFVVGNGTSNTARSNAFVVRRDAYVGIGVRTPAAKLDIAGGNWDLVNGEGDLRIGNGSYRLKMGVAVGGGGAGAAGIIQHGATGGYNVLALGAQGHALMYLNGNKGSVGIGTDNGDFPLTFANALGNKIALWSSTASAYYGLGIQERQLQLFSDDAFSDIVLGYGSSAAMTINMRVRGNGSAWLRGALQQNSDRRLKEDIRPIAGALPQLLKIGGYHYHWKDKSLDAAVQTGVLAQEVQAVFPELVKADEKGILSVNYAGLTPYLIEAVKEQQAQLQNLQQQLDAHEDKVRELEKKQQWQQHEIQALKENVEALLKQSKMK